MPNLIWAEPGTCATFDTKMWDQFGGVSDSSSLQTYTGPRSLRLDQLAAVGKNAVLTTANRRLSFRFYLGNFAGSEQNLASAQRNSDGEQCFYLRVSASNALNLANNAGSQIGPTGATVAQATWTRITLTWNITDGSTNEFRVYVNGTLSITATNVSLGTFFQPDNLDLYGCSGPAENTFFSDIYIDDGSGLDDCGDVRVTAKRPVSNGAANQFNQQIGAGGSGYGSGRSPQVNERPLSETNGWRDTLTGAEVEAYTLEAASVGDVDISSGFTILSHMAWVRAKITVASVAANIIDNGTSFAVTLTTSPATYFNATTSASYPSSSNGIGLQASTTANTELYECGTVIVYTPGAAPDAGGFSQSIFRPRLRTY